MEITEEEIIIETSDNISPVIEIISPEEDKTYLNNQTLDLDYSISDDKSPLEKIQVKVYLDNQELDEKSINLAFQKLGEHKLKITASDEAGNIAEKEIKFNSETNLTAIKDNIDSYFEMKLIKNRPDRLILTGRLKLIEKIQELIKKTENNRFIKAKTKEKLVKIFQDQVNKHLNWMQNYVQRKAKPKFNKGIDLKVSELLIESLEFVKYK